MFLGSAQSKMAFYIKNVILTFLLNYYIISNRLFLFFGWELILASSDYHSILLIGYDNTGFYHIESIRPNHIYHMKYDKLKRGYNWFDKKAILYK